MTFTIIALAAILATPILAEIHQLEPSTLAPPPKPYAFGYAAGRFPGHIDRTHSEVSDGSGVVQGSYSYVDPRFKIRTVEYIADQNGFHVLNGGVATPPADTPIVAAAKNRHLQQYQQIANARTEGLVVVPVDTLAVSLAKNKHLSLFEKIAAEHAQLAAQLEAEKLTNEGATHPIYQ